MYKKHFGLERRIFRGNAAGADVFVGPQTAGVLTGIKKALTAPDAVVTLTGPVGCGKSTAVAHSLGAISGKNAIVRVGRFPLQRGELLDLLFDHMRIQQRPQRGNQKLALFRQLLFNLAQNDSRMFLLVEDAPFLGPDMLAELEVVTAADTGPSDGAAVVLMGDEYLKELLASKSLARLRQRVRLRRHLEPCGVEELNGYLRHCFRQAGGEFDRIFANGATELLHELSGGILRVVNNLVESSLEASADAKVATVELDLISRIADEEFGLTGTFSRLPEISSTQPEPRHSDDATAELVAVSMPQPAAGPRLEASAVEPPRNQDDVDIPELIQDTQPALAILNDAPPPAKPAAQRRIQDTLPDIEALSAELGAETPIPEAAESPRRKHEKQPRPEATDKAHAGDNGKPTAKATPEPEPSEAPKAKPAASKTPKAKPQPKPDAVREPDAEAASRDTGEAQKPDVRKPVAPEPELKLELEKKPEPATEEEIPTLAEDETPAWDRDPTLAELRPDLDALERAMAVAQGRESGAADEAAPPIAEPTAEMAPKEEIEEIPEITLDDSINRKVDRAALEKKQRLEKEGLLADDADDGEKVAVENLARDEKAEAELEKIAAGLARAKTIEDVDDKMAETLFGEELSVAAAAVAARVAEEAAAAAAEASAAPEESAAPAPAPKSGMEKEFENVWGETPNLEVSIDSELEDQKRGLDISASQRLATVRALNTGDPNGNRQRAANAPPPPAARPDPIEEQITTSLTQTMKALKVNPDPAAVNDDDDDDERKGGFFSRFRRS